MRPFLVIAIFAALLNTTADDAFAKGKKSSGGAVHVRGYTRKDGTYVRPHYRSRPDGNFSNNWSTKGNVNPYTGETGTKTSPSRSYVPSRSYSTSADAGSRDSPVIDETYFRPLPTPRQLSTRERTEVPLPLIGSDRRISSKPQDLTESSQSASNEFAATTSAARSIAPMPSTPASDDRHFDWPVAVAIGVLGIGCWLCLNNGDRTWRATRAEAAFRHHSMEEWTKVALPARPSTEPK